MKSGILFFGLLLTFLLTANLATAQSCNPAACSKTADKSACAKVTKSSTAAVTVDEIVKAVTNAATQPNCNTSCVCPPDCNVKCTEEQKKNCTGTCPAGCCAGSESKVKTVKTADVKTAETTAKSSKM